ncbi:MAG: ATP synthase F0 subunit B [Nitrospirae bacterium]|nr:ATP synthase F0 subunit B [Nitrospirota bacterium]
MLDIHVKWLLVLMANFLGLLFLLNIILFKPLLKIFKERKDAIGGSLDAAKEMGARKEEGIARMNREIAEARNKAKDAFEGLRNEGLGRQKEVFSEAEANAAGMLQKAREELRAEVIKARQALKSDVEKFSDEIVRKLVKA